MCQQDYVAVWRDHALLDTLTQGTSPPHIFTFNHLAEPFTSLAPLSNFKHPYGSTSPQPHILTAPQPNNPNQYVHSPTQHLHSSTASTSPHHCSWSLVLLFSCNTQTAAPTLTEHWIATLNPSFVT
ncbi:hypothetical protein E2C01_053394 [Portunus trituberculatus]|uniref:Uncharacterized protein n=1 Tax=Portunus trituberculatus TaxID=210409 RepID=A0A5B7GPD1_PORTR|nr:hypothetical protein [Portunus trituberculatus]